MYRTLLRTIQKMLNSHQRCSNSSIFCINAKTCTTRNLHEVLQARTYQRNICDNFAWFLYYPCSHRTLFWSSGWCHWRQWPDISAEREPVGHPWQYKIEDIGNTQEGEKLDINISDIETSARGLRNTWVYTGCVMKKKHIVWAGRWVMCFFFMFLADRM